MQCKTPEELEVLHYANQVASAAHVQVQAMLCHLLFVHTMSLLYPVFTNACKAKAFCTCTSWMSAVHKDSVPFFTNNACKVEGFCTRPSKCLQGRDVLFHKCLQGRRLLTSRLWSATSFNCTLPAHEVFNVWAANVVCGFATAITRYARCLRLMHATQHLTGHKFPL